MHGLHIREVELLNETRASLANILRGSNDRHHKIYCVERNQETLKQVQPALRLIKAELGATTHDIKAMFNVVMA